MTQTLSPLSQAPLLKAVALLGKIRQSVVEFNDKCK
jgi:hypothetical protein